MLNHSPPPPLGSNPDEPDKGQEYGDYDQSYGNDHSKQIKRITGRFSVSRHMYIHREQT